TVVELRRTEYLLPLELLNRVNVLSALLVSHAYELNSCYTDLVASRVRLQEKLNRKKGDVKLLRLEVASLDNKLEKVKRDYDALGFIEELPQTDAKLSEHALTADFNEVLVAFPTTSFPFLGKIAAKAGGAVSEVTQILPDKLARSVTPAPISLSTVRSKTTITKTILQISPQILCSLPRRSTVQGITK
nr:hypothetical protein [Tanacetum cinerariifolium]